MEDKKFWDKLALDFPRYNNHNDKFQQNLIKILKNRQILTSNSIVLDIGCGTGIYTIPIAKEVKKVLAIDISNNMLEFLKKDASFYNVNDVIDTKVLDWKKFESDKKYDIVFASLSAAFKDNEDFEKILKYSNSFICFLDFVNTQGSNFEKLLYEKYGIKEKEYRDLENIKSWLQSKNIKYNNVPLRNKYSKLLDKNIAIHKINNIVKGSGAKLNLTDNEIEILVESITINGKVKHEFDMELELIYWKN